MSSPKRQRSAYCVPSVPPLVLGWNFRLQPSFPLLLLRSERPGKLGSSRQLSARVRGRAVTDQNFLLPSFFIVGPPRTGTSWLHEILQSHTCLPRVKETRFFDERFDRGVAWYR